MARCVLMCGLAGAGKSTVARALEADGWLRLSIDVDAWAQGFTVHPLPRDVRDRIVDAHRARLIDALSRGVDVVVDYAFWSRAMREEFRALAATAGAAVTVAFLDVPLASLEARLAARVDGQPGPDAIEVPASLLTEFAAGFEWPEPDETDVIRAADAGAMLGALRG